MHGSHGCTQIYIVQTFQDQGVQLEVPLAHPRRTLKNVQKACWRSSRAEKAGAPPPAHPGAEGRNPPPPAFLKGCLSDLMAWNVQANLS